MFGVKCEAAHGEDYTNEVANGFRGDRFISTFLKEIDIFSQKITFVYVFLLIAQWWSIRSSNRKVISLDS